MKISIEEEVIFNDRKVAVIKFVNNNNDELILSNYGATIMAIKVQTPNKPKNDITLGFDKIEDYINSSSENNQYYFGSTIGRYANRISNACFKIKDEVIQLSKNEGKNHLHGGFNGLNKVVWNYKITENNNEIIFTYQSKSGEEGYPGNLNISLSVSFTDLGEIKLKYKATTDKPTPINLTNHVYFNLNPKKKNILKHAVTLHSDYILETDEYKIPTGNFIPVLDTDFDFNSATVLENLNQMKNEGFDHCFVLLKSNENLELVGEIAELNNPVSVEIYTTEPSLQLFTANSFNGKLVGKSKIRYDKFHGICLETMKFPDSPNHDNFPNTIIYPDDVYEQETIYKIKKN